MLMSFPISFYGFFFFFAFGMFSGGFGEGCPQLYMYCIYLCTVYHLSVGAVLGQV